jgi:exodeoxyribonuclease VII large subunit
VDQAGQRTYGVAELSAELARLLTAAFPAEVWVQGQLRNLNRSAGGHVYFDLVEPSALGARSAAQLPVTLFDSDRRSVNARLRRSAAGMRMTDGIEARIRGRLQWYGPGGRLTLRMTTIDPAYTLGRLSQDRDRLIAALDEEGLLHRNGLLPLPPVPLRLGLVTSIGSAAHADFLTELQGSRLGWQVAVVDTRTQGQAAPASIVAALRTLVARRLDAIAVVRGGGSRTDLAPFDDGQVARAIALLDVPVLTGIGHEVDTAVADLVAHTAAKTPTACAAALVEQVRRFLIDVEGAWEALAARADRRLGEAELATTDTARHARRATRGALAIQTTTCEHAATRLGRAAALLPVQADARIDRARAALADLAGRPIERVEHRLATADAVVRGADPARALARGWSLTHRADGSLVRRAADLEPGERLVTRVAEGTVTSSVVEVAPDGEQTAERHGP